jgi:hypothetical protein
MSHSNHCSARTSDSARVSDSARISESARTSDSSHYFHSFCSTALFENDLTLVLECGRNKTALQVNMSSALLLDDRAYASHDSINC